jgi:hypothetical protein
MATAADMRRIALSLKGTIETPHFNRPSFKVARIYATLSPDGLSANLKFSPEEQEFKILLAPNAFEAVPKSWGEQGWTTVKLAALSNAELTEALKMSWRHACVSAGKGKSLRSTQVRQ